MSTTVGSENLEPTGPLSYPQVYKTDAAAAKAGEEAGEEQGLELKAQATRRLTNNLADTSPETHYDMGRLYRALIACNKSIQGYTLALTQEFSDQTKLIQNLKNLQVSLGPLSKDEAKNLSDAELGNLNQRIANLQQKIGAMVSAAEDTAQAEQSGMQQTQTSEEALTDLLSTINDTLRQITGHII